jgi:cell wall-associated NlpC family hydrolase
MIADHWSSQYVGVPYLINGRDRDGWDCWGLVLAVFREQRGVDLPDWRVEKTSNKRDEIAEAIRAIGDAVEREQTFGRAHRLAGPVDFSIAVVERNGRPNHVGVIVEGGVLHCSHKTGGTVFEPIARFEREYPGASYWLWEA